MKKNSSVILFLFFFAFILLSSTSAYAEAYLEPKTNISFPESLAGWHSTGMHNYENDYPGLGISVGYNNPAGITATIYIYNLKMPVIATGAGNEVKQHFQQAVKDIYQAERLGTYKNVKKESEDVVTLGTTQKRQFMKTAFSLNLFGEDQSSYIYLTGYKNQFIKIRITHGKTLAKKDEETITDLLNTFADMMK